MLNEVIAYFQEQQPYLVAGFGPFAFGLKAGCLVPLAFLVIVDFKWPFPASWLALVRAWLVGFMAAWLIFWPKTGIALYDMATTACGLIVALMLLLVDFNHPRQPSDPQH